MNTLSKEYIAETKKEIQRLEVLVRNYESRIETLQELLRENAGQEPAPKVSNRKKVGRATEAEPVESTEQNTVANA